MRYILSIKLQQHSLTTFWTRILVCQPLSEAFLMEHMFAWTLKALFPDYHCLLANDAVFPFLIHLCFQSFHHLRGYSINLHDFCFGCELLDSHPHYFSGYSSIDTIRFLLFLFEGFLIGLKLIGFVVVGKSLTKIITTVRTSDLINSCPQIWWKLDLACMTPKLYDLHLLQNVVNVIRFHNSYLIIIIFSITISFKINITKNIMQPEN